MGPNPSCQAGAPPWRAMSDTSSKGRRLRRRRTERVCITRSPEAASAALSRVGHAEGSSLWLGSQPRATPTASTASRTTSMRRPSRRSVSRTSGAPLVALSHVCTARRCASRVSSGPERACGPANGVPGSESNGSPRSESNGSPKASAGAPLGPRHHSRRPGDLESPVDWGKEYPGRHDQEVVRIAVGHQPDSTQASESERPAETRHSNRTQGSRRGAGHLLFYDQSKPVSLEYRNEFCPISGEITLKKKIHVCKSKFYLA